ncbi:MAG: proline--tRNA ligase [Oscillospiraceae bacterium]|nr:proline--tRNA ligase [Oscillospiraceae bacterium]MDD4369268.1 proline--tRNA ligase [Oscillospiraceae bacterium]
MAKEKYVESITSRDVDFAQWYTDVVRKAEMADYSSVRGCMILRPLGCAVWENIQKGLDSRFKALGHENVCMPMFIPESLLDKEAEHVEGFAPEVAWVTMGGTEQLQERLAVRPTSEALFSDHYAKIVQSYRDLPKLYNQWVSVVRWEKTTRPFLRTTEFWWQEGHTVHETAAEAQQETLRMLDTYAEFCKTELAIPVVKGRKTDKEKFAGAEATYTIEAMMHDGKSLQAATSHYFGDGFARAFGIQFSNRENKLQYVYQTSWGASTRLIGALIMVHSDDNGLLLPPHIAPTQVMVVPVAQHKPGVLEACQQIVDKLSLVCRIKMDASDKMPGWKFSEHEMHGIPLRLELGPKDLANGQAIAVRRDTGEKQPVSLDNLADVIPDLLEQIQRDLYDRAWQLMQERTYTATDWDSFSATIQEKPGFVKAMWCGEQACEDKIKEAFAATARCMPFEQEHLADTCVCCGKPAKSMVIWGKAY